jgi:hypothetical protein
LEEQRADASRLGEEGEGQKGKKTTSVRLAIRTRSRKPLFLSKATEARIAGK